MSVCCHPWTVYHLYGFSRKYCLGKNVIPLHEISLYMILQTEYMAKENFVSLEIRIWESFMVVTQQTCRLRRVLTWDHVTKMAKWGVQVEDSLRNKLRNPKEIDTIITAAIIRNLKGVKVSHTLLQFKFSCLWNQFMFYWNKTG
jgi:hypothetical protein